ncbi:MAG: recombinase family protein, partial [Actinomycetes bacterium]
VQDNLDSSHPDARLLIAMLSELARTESANMGLRIRSAKAYLRTQGRWIGGKPPYGLVNRDGRLHVDPEAGRIVREIGRRILEGASLTKVTLWLNAEAIPSPRGGKWNVGSLSQLLRGPATAGLLPETLKQDDGRYSGVVKPWRDPETGETISIMGDGEEPLISPADQARIVSAFELRAMLWSYGKRTRRQSPESRHLLTGLLRCAGCGERMSKAGDSYRCQSVRLGRTCITPGGAYQETLDAAVVRAWIARLTTADPADPLLDAVADRWVARHNPEAVAKRASVLAALDQEEAALAALGDDHHVHRTLDPEGYVRVSAALSRRIEGLQRTLTANPVPEADISLLLDPVLVREAWQGADMRAQRDLLKLALLEVRVSQGILGRRFAPSQRLTFVWATNPPTVTGASVRAEEGVE